MQSRNIVLVCVSLLLSVSMAVAQDVCPDIVAEALTATDSFCSQIGRNEACYGNLQISAELADEDLVFESQGDIVELTEVERLTLSPLIEESTQWGVALLNVQANIPDTVPGQGVMFLLFGDVDIENAGDAMEAFYFSSGVGEAACNEAENGIMIHTPEGVGMVSLIANDVTIELGSTAVLTAQPDDLMTIALLEGNATVTADDVSQEFEGGFQVTVPLNEDLEAIGPPSEPEPIPDDIIGSAPDIMLYVEEAETSDEFDDDTASVENDIVPLSGLWSFAVDSVDVSEGCPPGMADAMTSAPIPSSEVEFGDTFDLQTMMESTGDMGDMDVTYDNPEPNMYTMEFTQEGVTLSWTMILVSDSLMTGAYSVDMSSLGMACVLGIKYNVALEG